MTNFDRWRAYTSGLSSPQNYIDWSWLYMVGAALQRRVWLGPDHQPCFPNKYVIFVGEPGIGKGLPINQVMLFLKHWKKKDAPRLTVEDTGLLKQEIDNANVVHEADEIKSTQKEYQGKAKGAKDVIEPLLLPMAADATTYEALTLAVGESFRMSNFVDHKPDGTKKLGWYGHSSLCFVLPELASLFRKRTEDTINYMLGLYDCPLDYEYATLTRGKDRVRRGCLNVLAGTTPSFMQSTFDDKLADEGFNSRTFYIYAKENRKNQFFIPALTPEQEQYRTDLLAYIRRLSTLYGNVKVDEETWQYLQSWWEEQEKNKDKRVNKSVKLKPFYSRMNIHVMKIAMAFHFSESLEMFIPLETFKRAIDFLQQEIKTMHLAINLQGNTPESKLCNKVIESLNGHAKDFVEILCDCRRFGNKSQLTEALDTLEETGEIVRFKLPDEITGEQILHWKQKEKEKE